LQPPELVEGDLFAASPGSGYAGPRTGSAARSAAFRGFHRLAVDHPGRRLCRPTSQKARRHHQRFVDDVEHAAIAQPVEIVLDRRERRKIPGKVRPLATRCRDMLNGIPYLAHPQLAPPADRVREPA